LDYLELLENSFSKWKELQGCGPETRLEYLSDYVFDFCTYDSDLSIIFATMAVDVCEAINKRTTFEYINKGQSNYQTFVLMCNIPFFADRIEWGTSIRGAFWNCTMTLSGRIFWFGDTQGEDDISFTKDKWEEFITAVCTFADKGE